MSQFSILATGRQVDVNSVTVDVQKLGRKPQLEQTAALVIGGTITSLTSFEFYWQPMLFQEMSTPD